MFLYLVLLLTLLVATHASQVRYPAPDHCVFEVNGENYDLSPLIAKYVLHVHNTYLHWIVIW